MIRIRCIVTLLFVSAMIVAGVAEARTETLFARKAGAAARQPLAQNLDSLVGSQDAVMLTDPRGNRIYAKNPDKLLVPASTLKILTALAAIRVLGADYRFHTDFYRDASGNLKVKGYGDPLLLSEVLALMAQTLRPHLSHLHHLILDDSYFDISPPFPGGTLSAEPHYAPPGALSANFNTIHVVKNARGEYISAESQTPLPPFAAGRIQGATAARARVVFSHNASANTLYAGHLLAHFLTTSGITINGSVQIGRVDHSQDQLLVRFTSPFALTEIIARLMEYSNNFMANQLFLATAAAFNNPPAQLEQAVLVHREILADILDIPPPGRLLEGAGLAAANRLSARQLDRALEAFAPYYYLLRRENHEYYKTGTLSGVRARAGYLDGPNQERYRFVVLLNSPGRTTTNIMQVLTKMAASGP